MKEHIYTIPVMDAFRVAAGENACPICAMRRKLETDSLDYTLGPSYMEDDTREQTDKMGFCAEHWEKLYACQNRLGLSLIMHTHIQHIIQVMDNCSGTKNPAKRAGIFSRPTNAADPLYDGLHSAAEGCFICARINQTLDRYINTMFFMWPKSPELHTLMSDCGGFCLTHFVTIFQIGAGKLKAPDWLSFLDAVVPIQRKTLEAIESDLEWFIKKFDYRYADKQWGNSKDALPRALKTIGSVSIK